MQEYFPKVVQVIPFNNYHVQVFFDDGKIVEYDFSNELQETVFQPLQDVDVFKNTCTVDLLHFWGFIAFFVNPCGRQIIVLCSTWFVNLSISGAKKICKGLHL